jgi:cytochrome c-type biogenesis protein CcmH
MRRLIFISLSLLSINTSLFAVEPDEILSDPALETRARALSKTLRCMVCQNQSIDDSEAPLARDLRVILREHIKAGDSDSQIRDFLVARYGEFVLLEPRLNAHTILLWSIPSLILLIGAATMALMRLRQPKLQPNALSREEEKRLAKLIKDPGDLTNL